MHASGPRALILQAHTHFLVPCTYFTLQGIPGTPLTIGGTVQECDDLGLLAVTFDSKITFEKHLRSVSRAASQRLGILREVLPSVP